MRCCRAIRQPYRCRSAPALRGSTRLSAYDENDTMNTKPKLLAQQQPMTLGIKVRSAKQFFFGCHHEHHTPGKSGPFRRHADAPVGEWSHSEHRPPRAGLRYSGQPHRPSPVRRGSLAVRRRQRDSLASKAGRWPLRISDSLADFCRWVVDSHRCDIPTRFGRTSGGAGGQISGCIVTTKASVCC